MSATRPDEKGDGPRVSLADWEAAARRALDPATWDFIAGGAEDELTLADNVAAFRRVRLRPRVLSGVTAPDTRCVALGAELRTPLAIAPIGLQKLVHPEGELATARAAKAAGTLMVVSTMSTVSLEEIAAAAPGPLWFQLYVLKARDQTLSLVRRAERSGYRALVVTVDAPRIGRRERDLRRGFALPPGLVAANLPHRDTALLGSGGEGRSGVATHAAQAFEEALDWETIGWLRRATSLPMVLKGILTREDAERAVLAGIDGLIVSNHGGRQLDGAEASLDALPAIAEAVGDRCEVYLDGGVRRGVDALKAKAFGARLVFVGRPALWGLAVAGETGVREVLGMLEAELAHAMVLTGCSSFRAVERSSVARRSFTA